MRNPHSALSDVMNSEMNFGTLQHPVPQPINTNISSAAAAV